MSAEGFDVGDAYRRAGRQYAVIDAVGARKRVVRDVESEEVHTCSTASLRQAYAKGEIVLEDLFAKEPTATALAEVERSMWDYTARQISEVKIKLYYLTGLCPGGQIDLSREELTTRLSKLYEEWPAERFDGIAKPQRCPSVSSFYGWLRSWRQGGFQPHRLVNRYDLRGRKPEALVEPLRQIVEQVIDEDYADKNRIPATEALDLIEAKVHRYNKGRPPAEQIPKVSRRQWGRVIARLDRADLIQRRYGRAVAQRQTAIFGKGPEPMGLLERVEMDHTPLDLLCIADKTQMIPGRPHLTVLIDKASRMILGAWISFRPPNTSTLLRVLKQAIRPKDALLKKYGIKGKWPAFGVMPTLVVDNGKEFHSAAFEVAAMDLGISLVYCPVRQPIFKGVVERFLKSINYSFAHLQPGTTFAKYFKREDYDSGKNTVIPFETLKRFVFRWIVEVYHAKYHRGILDCPLKRWETLARERAPVLPRRVDALDTYLTECDTRTLSSKGIEINSLFYGGRELADIRLRMGHGVKDLTVRADPDDLGYIHVLNPETKTYFKALCTHPEYADGLTLEQHQWFRRHASETYKQLPHREAMLAAKLEMREEVRRLSLNHENLLERLKRAKGKGLAGKVRTSRGKRPSGLDLQAHVDTLAHIASAPEVPREPEFASALSLDALEPFSTGQLSLID